MTVINEANAIIAKFDDGKTVPLPRHRAGFPRPRRQDPVLDHARPAPSNAAGYQLWADAMKPLLDEMLK